MVVDDHHLPVESLLGKAGEDGVDKIAETIALVVRWNDDTEGCGGLDVGQRCGSQAL